MTKKFFLFSSWPRFFSGVVILLTILEFEMGKIYFQVLFKSHPLYTELFDNLWLLTQLIGSTFLGFVSDRFYKIPLRKPVAIFGIIFFLSTILILKCYSFISLFFLIFCIILNGFFGSYLGVARAFFFDQCHKKDLLHFVITIFFQCIAWMGLGYFLSAGKLTYPQVGNCIIYSFPLILLGLFFAKNQDRPIDFQEAKHPLIELANLKKKFMHKFFVLLIFAYFILNSLYEIMPYFGEFTLTIATMNVQMFFLGFGSLIGATISLFLRHLTTVVWLKNIYLLTAFVFIAFSIKDIFIPLNPTVLIRHFFIFAILATLLWPLTVKEFIVRSTFNEAGFILGFLESISTFSDLTASLLLSTVFLKSIVTTNIFYAAAFVLAYILLHFAVRISKKLNF